MEVDFRPLGEAATSAPRLPDRVALSEAASAALRAFWATPLPTTDDELWRYTDVSFLAEAARELPDEVFESAGYARAEISPGPLGSQGGVSPPEIAGVAGCDPAVVEGLAPLSGSVSLSDGVPVSILLSAAAAEAGVTVVAEAPEGTYPDGARFSLVSPAQDKFTALVAAVGPSLRVRVPDGVVLTEPLFVCSRISARDGRPTVAPWHLGVELGKGVQVRLFVYHFGRGPTSGPESLSLPVTEIHVGEGSRLEYVSLQELDLSACHVETSRASLGRDAWISSTAVALGARLARQRVETVMAGENSESEMLGIYFGAANQHIDFRTLQDHQAPRTVSDLFYKGAVEDSARAVYAGLVRVEKGAQKISGFQTNRNLVLSEGASAESIPNLEILANDVRCSHASSIGPIDDDELYYLQSRGIDPEMAERLIVEGFFEEVIERIPSGLMAERIREEISDKFQAREGTER